MFETASLFLDWGEVVYQ